MGWGGGRGCSKTNKDELGGGGGSKLGNLERTYFLNVPFPSRQLATDFTNMFLPILLFGEKKNIKTRTLIGLTEIIYSKQ